MRIGSASAEPLDPCIVDRIIPTAQEIAFNYTRDAGGISLESSYPYQGQDSACDPSQLKPVATIDGYVRLDSNNATQLTAAIANVGPIAISLAASGFSFQLYGGGVLSGDGCGT
jgi:hypothetical protein